MKRRRRSATDAKFIPAVMRLTAVHAAMRAQMDRSVPIAVVFVQMDIMIATEIWKMAVNRRSNAPANPKLCVNAGAVKNPISQAEMKMVSRQALKVLANSVNRFVPTTANIGGPA